MAIVYRTDCEGLKDESLRGFFVGWPAAPTPNVHRSMLERSSHVVLAWDEAADRVVGFVNAVSDGVLAAYIPLLEVLPAYQRQGIGSELLKRLFEQLDGLYMIDLACDPDRTAFYERVGMQRGLGMRIRNYAAQGGRIQPDKQVGE